MKLIYMFSCIWLPSIIFAQIPISNDPSYQLTFSDDFNGSALTPAWFCRDQFANGGAYTALSKNSNYIVQNGFLELTAKRENPPIPCTNYPANSWACTQPYYNFSGAWIESASQNYSYGYYETRVKMDYRPGFWPAFWLINSATTPHYSEIDIFETVGRGYNPTTTQSMNENYTTNNIHPYYGTQPDLYGQGVTVNDYRQFHTYGLEWYPNKISWYIDGILVRSISPLPDPYDVGMRVVFDVKFDSVLAHYSEFIDEPSDPVIPSKMTIDYFRYYQLKGDCSPPISVCSYNFNTHTNTTKQSYSIGGYCNNVVPSNQTYIFRGSDFVEFKDGFEVPSTANFYADCDNYCQQLNYSTGTCGAVLNPCSFDFSGYNNSVKYYIEISGTNCASTVNPTDNVQLKAIEYINLKEGFSVPLGSEIQIKTQLCPP